MLFLSLEDLGYTKSSFVVLCSSLLVIFLRFEMKNTQQG